MYRDESGVVIEFRRKSLCRHNRLQVDDTLEKIFCKDCKEQLNPFFAIKQLMSMSDVWKRQKAQADLSVEAAEKKTKTKCQHCGKMTKVSVTVKQDDLFRRMHSLKNEIK